jgi:hypothetical protein
MMHALAVTVEPFKFSSRQGGVVYELSKLATGVSAQRLNLAVSQKGLGYAKKIVLRFVPFSNRV